MGATDAQIRQVVESTVGPQIQHQWEYLQQLAGYAVTKTPAVQAPVTPVVQAPVTPATPPVSSIITSSVIDQIRQVSMQGDPAPKAALYRNLRQAGASDEDVLNAVTNTLGAPDPGQWSLLRNLAGYAKGGIFTNGIVSEPTLFPNSVMGEAGSEAIVPLTRGPDGTLGVRNYGSSAADSADNSKLHAELVALRAALENLQNSNTNENYVVAKNIMRVADRLDRWDDGDRMNVNIDNDTPVEVKVTT
jgi:hypothetical protein